MAKLEKDEEARHLRKNTELAAVPRDVLAMRTLGTELAMVMIPMDLWKQVCRIAEHKRTSPAGVLAKALELYMRDT